MSVKSPAPLVAPGHVIYESRALPAADSGTLLELLLASGIDVPSGCRSGICQACLLQCVAGEPPATAQAGLRPDLRESGHLLACQAPASAGLHLRRPQGGGVRWKARVVAVTPLCDTVFRLRLTRPAEFQYRPGQYVTLWRDQRTCRAYSLASIPEEPFLECHVRRYENGRVSRWLATLRPGETVEMQGPVGNCCYRTEDENLRQRPLLLIGTGTGLAPLWGVVRTALAASHEAPVHLIHAARDLSSAYLDDKLMQLDRAYRHFSYVRHLSGPAQLDLAVHALSASFAGWEIFLCGGVQTVRRLRKLLFLGGAASCSIHADAFIAQTDREP